MSRAEESHFNLESKREKSNMSFGRNHKEKVSHRGGPWEGRVLMILHPLPQWSGLEGCVWVSTRKPGITSGILQTQVPGEGKKKAVFRFGKQAPLEVCINKERKDGLTSVYTRMEGMGSIYCGCTQRLRWVRWVCGQSMVLLQSPGYTFWKQKDWSQKVYSGAHSL